MKKIFLFALSAMFLTTSCNRNNDFRFDFEYPDLYCFATVVAVDAQPATDSDQDGDENIADIYFRLDSQETFIVTENVSKTNLDDLEVGKRVITGVTLTDKSDSSYNYTAKLFEVVDVLVGQSLTITDEQQSDSIANHQLSYIAKDITLTLGYLNLLTGVVTEKQDDIKFYLVDNQCGEKDAYLYLELRYDSASQEGKGTKVEQYVSFDMESYREQLEGKKGVILSVNTEKSGDTTVIVNSTDLFLDEE
ncbi:MAG: NigD-like C-terminal domain-containing protein [Rikenellaceae bacterium]